MMSRYTKATLNLHRLITPDQASDTLGVTTGTLQIWRSTGRYNLPYVKVGGRVMYRTEDIEDFIHRRVQNHTGEEL